MELSTKSHILNDLIHTFYITSNILRYPSCPIVSSEFGLFCKWIAAVIWLNLKTTLLFMSFRNLEEFNICLFSHSQHCLHFRLSIWVQRWSLHFSSCWLKGWWLILILIWSWSLFLVLFSLFLICLLSLHRLFAIFKIFKLDLTLDCCWSSWRMRDNKDLFRTLTKLIDLIFKSYFLDGVFNVIDNHHTFVSQMKEQIVSFNCFRPTLLVSENQINPIM